MNEIRDAILVCLRSGKSTQEIIDYLQGTYHALIAAKDYKPNDDVALYAQAIKDSDFRP
jgi:cytochrome c-type biogenesis protein CcmH/NrfF